MPQPSRDDLPELEPGEYRCVHCEGIHHITEGANGCPDR